MIQHSTECGECVSLCVLRLGFNLFHYFLLQVGITEVIAVIDNLVLLKFRLKLTFPLRHIICTKTTSDFTNTCLQ